MSETDALEVYTSSKILTGDREKTVSRIEERIKADNNKEFLYLCGLEKPEDEKRAAEIDAVCSLEIKRVHEEAGVPLEKDQIPFVFIVPANSWGEVITHFNKPSEAAGFATDDRSTVVVKEHTDTLFMAATTIHEMTHAVGRAATVVTPGKYGDRLLGYTTNIGEGKEDAVRGEALEEGVAEYVALKLVLDSHYPIIESAREESAKKMGVDALENVNEAGKNFLVKLDHQVKTQRKYTYAETLVETLVNDGGKDMESLLLSARIDTKKRGQLVHRINTTYNSTEAAKRIFQTSFEAEDIADTVTWLKQQTAIIKIDQSAHKPN